MCTAMSACADGTRNSTGNIHPKIRQNAISIRLKTAANGWPLSKSPTGGTNAAWQFGGLSGITTPQQIPNNYVVPVKSTNGRLLANVILNEVILPDPNDGSITLNMMHIVLFPTGTAPGQIPLSGDIYVGSTACSPTP